MRAMQKLIEQGSIRFAGVSNLDVEELGPAYKSQQLACNQVLYNLNDRGIERRVLPYCAERRIAVVAYSPFNQKRFPAKSAVLQEIAQRHGKTPRQVALNFLTRDPDRVRHSQDVARRAGEGERGGGGVGVEHRGHRRDRRGISGAGSRCAVGDAVGGGAL